jgi:hypothetical protein
MAAKKETSKLHHYVPQSYLRGFANEKEHLTVVRLPGDGPSFTSGVRGVGAQTHFHRVEELEKPDAFEGVLSDIEGAAYTVIRGLIDGGSFPLTEEDRASLALFVAVQAVRGPDTRRTIEMVQSQITRLEIGVGGRKNVRRWIVENMGFEPTEEQESNVWAEATQPGGPPVTFTNLVHINQLMDMATKMMPLLASRPWILVRFSDQSLITCDSPVTLIADARQGPGYGVGFATAWGVCVPLSRHIGLLMGDPSVMNDLFSSDDPTIDLLKAAIQRGEMDLVEAGSPEMESLFNDHTARNASEYLYHHPEDAAFVPERLHGPKLVNATMSGGDISFADAPWPDSDPKETGD